MTESENRPRVRIEVVTPKKAKAWLEGNIDNRKFREPHALKLAKILERGEWELTGDCIVFDDQDVLINGQHRLTAIVVSEIPAQLVILRGVPSKTQEVMDTGLTRNLGDQLHRRGVPYSLVIAGALGWLYQFDYNERTGNVHYANNETERPSYRQLLALFEENKELVDDVPFVNRIRHTTKVRPGPTLALVHRLKKIDDTDAEDFFDKLRTGANLSEMDPIFRLRAWCLEDARLRTTRGRAPVYRYCAYVLTAWNKWRDGAEMAEIRWHFGGTRRDPWPTPY